MVSPGVSCCLLFLIASVMFRFWYSNSSYSFFVNLQSFVTLYFTGLTILLRIFLSKTRSLFSLVFQIAQVSAPYLTISLINVMNNCFFKSLNRDRVPYSLLVQKSIYSQPGFSHLFSLVVSLFSVRIVPRYLN